MSNNNLIAVQRPNKHGVMVTRWVKPETAAGTSAAKIAAPSLKKQGPAQHFQSNHIANSFDPRVLRGEVIDRIVHDGRIYSRSREGVTPDTPNFVRIQLDRPLLDGEQDQIASLVGYAWKVKMRPDNWADAVDTEDVDSPYSVVLSVDLYREAPRNNEHRSLREFEAALHEYFSEGSPIRTTERAGRGTKDTRLVEGLAGGSDLSFEVYYDSVEGDNVAEIAGERGTTDIEVLDAVLGHDVQALAEGLL